MLTLCDSTNHCVSALLLCDSTNHDVSILTLCDSTHQHGHINFHLKPQILAHANHWNIIFPGRSHWLVVHMSVPVSIYGDLWLVAL